MNTTDVFKMLSVLLLAGASTGGLSQGPTTIIERVDKGTFTPPAQPRVVLESTAFSLSATANAGMPALMIRRNDGTSDLVDLVPSNIVQVNEIISLGDGRVAVIGMANSAVYVVALVDVYKALITDHFLAYSPKVSPDGSFIVFNRFYPPHTGDDESDCYAVYDTTRDEKANRPLSGIKSEFKYSADIDVGSRIFPVTNAADECPGAGPESTVHVMVSKSFEWAPTSDQVVFADQLGSDLDLILVKVDHASGKREVYERTLNEDGQVCAESCIGFVVHILSFNGKNISVDVYPPRLGVKPRHLDISTSEFIRVR